MYISRSIESTIKQSLFKKKIIIIYGARQTGKTTLVKHLVQSVATPFSYLNCDESDIRLQLNQAGTSTQLRQITGSKKLIIIDEAQRIKDIGIKLKLLIDTFPDQQIIATGSSSFELSNTITEPLTGRNFQFWLYPLSVAEMIQAINKRELNRQLESLLLYGSYPAVFQASSFEEKQKYIKHIASDYLYKDVLQISAIKKPDVIYQLLQALALQIGNQVSYTELANLLNVSKQVVASYIEILEQAFVIFRLKPFSRNLRKEIGKLRKIYFWAFSSASASASTCALACSSEVSGRPLIG